jgi:D-alanyl-lipoteichoic acid acyltransferase DltB (MBOAT superfamily)
MVIGGLWHGANWTFILWGALHGLALMFHRFVVRRFPPFRGRLVRLCGWAGTLLWVVVCFTIFRTPSIEEAWVYFTARSTASSLVVSLAWWLIIAALGLVQYAAHSRVEWLEERLGRVPDVAFYGGLGLAAAGLLYMTPTNMSPFIYFQF